MELIRNERGGQKLCHNGFMYTKKKTSTHTIRWECSKRRALNCLGAVTTDLQISEIRSSRQHSHETVNGQVEVTKKLAEMKENIPNNRGQPGQILADTVQTCSLEARAALGNMDSIKRTIRRIKQGQRPNEPASLRELELPEDWENTTDHIPTPFLIYDNGPEAPSRMLVFGTEEGLRHLSRSPTWFMDGTFSSAPRLFKQLFIIRAPIGDSAITCVYSFLSSKTQEAYEELFHAITLKSEELGFNLDPTRVISDYEQASIRAIQTTFGDHVESQGCFYHLTQSTWRKIQQLGLTQRYRDEEDVKLFCGMLDGLAFLPIHEVPNGMDFLKTNTPPGLESLVDYFDSVYVSGTYCRIQIPAANPDDIPLIRMRHIQPMFPPPLWNMFEPTVNNNPRTNNFCESWNFGFSKLVGHNNPSVWTAIDAIRKDQALVSVVILQNANGEPPRKRVKKVTHDLQRKLRNVCVDFQEGRKTVEELLRSVGQCIRWKTRE